MNILPGADASFIFGEGWALVERRFYRKSAAVQDLGDLPIQ